MPDIKGSKKPIPTKNKMNAPINNINSMPSFNSEEAFLLPEDKYISSPNISFSMQSPTIPSAIPPQSMPQQNVIRNSSLQMLPEEPVNSEDDTNFLGSLIAQGVAGIGTGLMGGTPRDIANSANMFQYMRDQQTKRNKSDLLMDPKSEQSKKRRLVFKNLGYDVPEDLSHADLEDPNVLRGLGSRQMEQPKLAGSTRQGGVSGAGGGVGKPKPEKEVKTDEKRLGIYRGLAESLSNSINVIENVEKLNRSRGGSFFPTINIDKKVTESLINQNAQPLIKQLAGVGTITDPEREEFKKLVPNADMSKEEALKLTQSMAQKSVIGTLEALNFDLQTGQISKKDYDTIIRLYNKNLSNPKLGINKIINEQGELVDSTSSVNKVKFNEEP